MKEIEEKFREIWGYDEQNRRDSQDDLLFRSGTQWDDADARIRKFQGRPSLVLSQIDQYVRRVVGQARSMAPSVRVFSSDIDTSPYMAQLFEGAIRDIEQRTNAQHARMNAHTDQVTCGMGHYEVCYDLHPTKPEMQISIKTIKDPLSVVWDPASQEIDRSDARFAFRLKNVPLVEFNTKFKDKDPRSFASSRSNAYSYKYYDNLRWSQGTHVTLCQNWEKYTKKHKFIVVSGGMTLDVTGMDNEEIAQFQPVDGYSRDIDHLKFQLLSGADILEEIEDFPCRHIPIIPVIGEEIPTGKGLYRQGLVRKIREPQKLYNYMMSIGMEQLGQSIKSPFLVTNEMLKGNENMWRQANTNALPFLVFNPDPDIPGLKPERIMSPTQHRDTMQVAQLFAQDMSNAAGLHEEALGKETNAKSGKAIEARQAESAVMTNVFGHNLQASIRQEGRVLLSMIQHLYTQNKTIRIITQERKEEFVEINKKFYHYQSDRMLILNDMTKGEFEVRADTGPSYGAVKQESLNALMQMVQLNPQMLPFIMPQMVDLMEVPNQEGLKEAVMQYQQATMGAMMPQGGAGGQQLPLPQQKQQLTQQMG